MVAGIDESIAQLAPTSELEYEKIQIAIRQAYPRWHVSLMAAQQELEVAVTARGFRVLTKAQWSEILEGRRRQLPHEVAVYSRLKSIEAIIEKMKRYDEPLFNMLDIWGYRLVVSDTETLENMLPAVTGLWAAPTSDELALRHGTLHFDWLRDYRTRSHAGLSRATSARYDEAIHVNRRPAFGVVEIQILTADLYRRAYLGTGEEAHVNFVIRRRLAETQRPKGQRRE